MGKSSEQHLQMRDDEVNGVPMYNSAPKETEAEPGLDYSLNDFEGLVKYASKYTVKERNLILDAVEEYKRLMNQF